jgi:DNA topoisomerase-1
MADCGNEPNTAFSARFYGRDGKKTELHSEAEVNGVIDAVRDEPFKISSVKRAKSTAAPRLPFITSTLQQEASRRWA